MHLRGHFPTHWQQLVAALREVSVRDHVERTQDAALRGLYNAVLHAYAGDKGWMGLHRIKAYGFLEVAFKVGRAVTTGAKFTGLFKDKTWDAIDGELSAVRDERPPPLGQQVVFARPVGARCAPTPRPAPGPRWSPWTSPGRACATARATASGSSRRTTRSSCTARCARCRPAATSSCTSRRAGRSAVRMRAGYSRDVKVLPLRTC